VTAPVYGDYVDCLSAYTSTAVAENRHGRRVRCIGLDVVDAGDAVDAVFRHTTALKNCQVSCVTPINREQLSK